MSDASGTARVMVTIEDGSLVGVDGVSELWMYRVHINLLFNSTLAELLYSMNVKMTLVWLTMKWVKRPGKSRERISSILHYLLIYSRNSGERLACGVIGIRRPTDRLPLPQPTQKATLGQQRPLSFVPTFQQQSQNTRTA